MNLSEGQMPEITPVKEGKAVKIPLKRRGPKPKLNEVKALEIIRRIEDGATVENACVQSGQSLSGFYRGMIRFDIENPEIRQAFARARATIERVRETKAVQRIEDAFEEDWRAAAWYLERRFPEKYGKSQVEIGGIPGGKPIALENKKTVDLGGLTLEQIAALRSIIDNGHPEQSAGN